MRSARGTPAGIGVIVLALVLGGCQREEPRFRAARPTPTEQVTVRMSTLEPGGGGSVTTMINPYAGDAHALSEGKRLYQWMNCVGCHANGGGAIGPPLMDDDWIYGNQPENIFATIIQGRPNGMPSFRGRLSNQQVWQLVLYVQSLSGRGAKAAGRP